MGTEVVRVNSSKLKDYTPAQPSSLMAGKMTIEERWVVLTNLKGCSFLRRDQADGGLRVWKLFLCVVHTCYWIVN